MKQTVLLLIFMVCSLCIVAQKHDANWVYTEMTYEDSTLYVLNFGEKGDTFILNSVPIVSGSSASYSTSSGLLKCFSDGDKMYGSSFSIMENGDSLGYNADWDSIPVYYTGSEFYSGEFLPWPGQADNKVVYLHYVVYYFTSSYRHKELWYTTVDLGANDGKGKVVEKNVVLSDNVYHYTCIQHGNGKDWWIISMKENLIEFDIFLLSESGLQFISTQSFPLPVYYSNYNRSPLISSPQGDWIYRQFNHEPGYLFQFNRCQGEVQFQTMIGIPDSISVPNSFGMSLPIGSPNGRFIYSIFQDQITIQGKKEPRPRIMQVDLDSNDPSFQFLYHQDLTNDGIHFPQITPDGRIYHLFEKDYINSLITIHRPDDLLDECGLEIPGKAFPPGFDTPSTPRFPNYRLGPLVGSECDTVTTSVAVPEMGKTYDMTLTPNPSSGPVDVEITLPEYQGHNVVCDVIDGLGKIVSSHTFPPFSYRHTLDTSAFAPGLYVVQLIVDGRVVKAEKLVVVGR
ncbi:MAG: T9SS type A sorting domain-containing protein [Saprospiraceae bacterium]|nr:T9SS type A sorting domain-containing protein [Saprospiraceae bacterium]